MRADSLGRWCARFAVASALGAAALAFAAGPALAAEAPEASTRPSSTSDTDWHLPPANAGGQMLPQDTDWH